MTGRTLEVTYQLIKKFIEKKNFISGLIANRIAFKVSWPFGKLETFK